VIITEFKEGETVQSLFRVAGKELAREELSALVLTVLRELFVALDYLSHELEFFHQDLKLDNVLYSMFDDDGDFTSKIRLFDLEFSVAAGWKNPSAGLVDGWGGQGDAEHATEGFDCHTAILFASFHCGREVGSLPKLKMLRKALLNTLEPKKGGLNSCGHANIYSPFPIKTTTFVQAIAVCERLLAE
jgi:hypothetical protein